MRSFLHGALGGATVVALAALLFALVGRDDATGNHTIEQVEANMAAMGFDAEGAPEKDRRYPFTRTTGPQAKKNRIVAYSGGQARAWVLEFDSAADAAAARALLVNQQSNTYQNANLLLGILPLATDLDPRHREQLYVIAFYNLP